MGVFPARGEVIARSSILAAIAAFFVYRLPAAANNEGGLQIRPTIAGSKATARKGTPKMCRLPQSDIRLNTSGGTNANKIWVRARGFLNRIETQRHRDTEEIAK
jgi:hypothetical protein